MISSDIRGRIDNAVRALKPFFDNNLPTLEAQIEGDKKYIKTMCDVGKIDSDPYIEYYNKRVDEEYRQ